MVIFNLFLRSEKGGALVEKCLIMILVAGAAFAALTSLGSIVSTDMSSITGNL